MSLRYFAVHFASNVRWLLGRALYRNRVIDTVLPQRGVAFLTIRSVGSHARKIFVDGRVSRVTSDWRRRFTNRLFYGDSAPTFALIGLSIAGGGILTKEDEQEKLCLEIREVIAKFPWKFDSNNPDKENISLKDLEIGKFISKGCSAVVYTTRIKDVAFPNGQFGKEHVQSANKEDNNFSLALKMMFNYDIQSNSMEILKAMYKETIPAQICQVERVSFWNRVFGNRKTVLPPHPNIIAIYNAFADYMPNIDNSMDIFPDALPTSYNPNGLGRNMTLFLLMKRYQFSLREYLDYKINGQRDKVLLFTQLVEAIVHMNRHGIAHRDLKTDNILIEEVCTQKDEFAPLLVVTDFGCCLADSENGLKIPYKSDSVDKGGNINLMAPEIITQQPGIFSILDYSKSDLWAAATIAYEIFGYVNPFVGNVDLNNTGYQLSNFDYDESQLPEMGPEVPIIIKNLITNLLSRNPRMRLNSEMAANVCQLYLWAPSSWLTSKKLPRSKDITKWLMCLTVKFICEGRLYNICSDYNNESNIVLKNINPDYMIIGCFLSRVRLSLVKNALKWIQSMN